MGRTETKVDGFKVLEYTCDKCGEAFPRGEHGYHYGYAVKDLFTFEDSYYCKKCLLGGISL